MDGTVKQYNGVEIKCHAHVNDVEATTSFKNTRITLLGTLCAESTTGSYRYGEQGLITLWTPNLPRIDRRAPNNGYSRTEIALKLFDMYLFHLKAAEEIRKELGL